MDITIMDKLKFEGYAFQNKNFKPIKILIKLVQDF